MKNKVYILIFVFLLCKAPFVMAQTEPEDVAEEKDEFIESYYESLIQKGIENYDKAIQSLEVCLKTQPENAVIHHELGKNYFYRKDYINAEKHFTKSAQIDPNNKWYLIDLYEVYYETKNYNPALLILQKIIPLDKNYKEDLVSLYMYTQQFDKALVLINELDENVGKSEFRDRYKQQILMQSNHQSGTKSELENAIESNPENEENYLSLIYMYSDNKQEEKARLVAEKLEKNIPKSAWAQVFLYKYHINENKGEQAFKSLEFVLKDDIIDKKIKFKMFNEFLIFAQNNPQYENQLNKATVYFENDKEFNVYKEIGAFYYKKKNWTQAIKNLEKTGNNYKEANLFLLSSFEEMANFEKLESKSLELIDLYPNQPEYYYFAGKASNLLKKHKQANDYLESGLEYVIENIDLEIDFLIALSDSSKGLNNPKKADEYVARANKLKSKRK
jgi:tetratricopeptide (TPR) repeat protein